MPIRLISKIMIIVLTLSFILPNIVGAQGFQIDIDNMDNHDPIINSVSSADYADNIDNNKKIEEMPIINSEAVSSAVYAEQPEKKLLNDYIFQLKANRSNGKKYIYTKENIEELILKGATREDIYLSDIIGNKWLVNPMELFDRKKNDNLSWEDVIRNLQTINPEQESVSDIQQTTSDSKDSFESVNPEQESVSDIQQTTSASDNPLLPSESNDTYNTSVLDSVYQKNINSITTYDQDINSVYNGLITQIQINQTNKPQYSDKNGTSEMVDPSSGKLNWSETNISLTGRDGLDLNIGVNYQSNYNYAYQRFYNGGYADFKKFNYLVSRYDLGVGWSFQFPSIQISDGYLYYHKGTGAVYQVDFSTNLPPDNSTHLIGYQGKDLKLMKDTSKTFNNGQASSSYYLEYADKKREYFADDGRLLGIVDRFGNTITFQHLDRTSYDGKVYKMISSITDSVGRIVTFTYDTTLNNEPFNGEGIVVSVKDTSGKTIESVTYMKSRSNDTRSGNPDGHSPFLWYIKNQNNDYTYFTHGFFGNNYFDYNNPAYTSRAGWMTFHPLTQVTKSNSQTNYQYEKVARRLGNSGFGEEQRISSRYDMITRTNNSLTGDFNHVNYSYSGDYTGYDPNSPSSTPSNYNYSSSQTIQSTSKTNGLKTTYNYNEQGQLLSTTIRANNGERKVINNTYSNTTFKSLPTQIESREYSSDNDNYPNILFSSTTYNDWGGIQKETLPLTETQYNNQTTKEKYTIQYDYDPTYYLLKSKAWYQNNETSVGEQYEYYTNGRLKSYTKPDNSVISYCYEAIDNGNITSNCSNSASNIVGKLSKIIETKYKGHALESTTEQIFNESTNYTYPSEINSYFNTVLSGQQIRQNIKKTMTYDLGRGLLASESDGNGNTTSYEYDALGRTTKITYPSFTNSNGIQYDVTDNYTYVQSLIPHTTDSINSKLNALIVGYERKYTQKNSGIVTTLSSQKSYYDGFGFLRYTVDSNDMYYSNDAIHQYHPDDLLRPVYAIDPLGNTTTLDYNSWGEQHEAFDTYGNLYVTESIQKARQKNNYFVAAADVSSYRNNPSQNSIKSSYVSQDYDQWGNLLANRLYKDWPNQSQPVSENFSYDIVGNVITYTDPKRNINVDGVTTKYKYDRLNRLIEVKDALDQITNYEYDLNGQITTVTTSNGGSGEVPQVLTRKSYNQIGLKDTKTDPKNNQELFSYNNLGLMQEAKDRNLSRYTYQYDQQNRPIYENIIGNNGDTQTKTFTIGNNDIKTDKMEFSNNGILSSSLTTQIDNIKRVTSIEIKADPFISQLGLNYDKNNRVTMLNVNGNPGTFYTQYKYSKLLLDKVQVNGQSTENDSDAANVKYSYFPNGQIQSISYPPLIDGSLLKTEYVYDSLKRLSMVTNKKGSTVLSSYSYTYDDNGNILTVSQTIKDQPSQTQTYTYDKLNRLQNIQRSDGTSASYSYDLKGNRLTLSETSNVKPSMDEATFQYDLKNTLIGAKKGTTTTTFDYSPDGLRYRKTTGTNVKQYKYNQNQEVISEVNGSNQTTANYVRGDRLLVKKDVTTNKDYYYLYNGHGDVIQLVDTNGNIVNSYSYDEWGNIVQQNEQIFNEFKYAGEIYDEETGLYYLRARYYDPSIGRFINEDKYEGNITNPLSLNLYTYVENDPLNYSDPTGHYKQSDDAKLRDMVKQYTSDWNAANKAQQSCVTWVCKAVYDSEKKEAERAADAIRTSYYNKGNGCGLTAKCQSNIPKDVTYREYSASMYNESKYGNAKPIPVSEDPIAFVVFSVATGGAYSKVSKSTTTSLPTTQKYYHVTSQERAQQIINEGQLVGSKQEANQVFVWTTRPTVSQAKNSGARYLDAVIEFEIPSGISAIDRTVVGNLQNYARKADGPLKITNARVVDFK